MRTALVGFALLHPPYTWIPAPVFTRTSSAGMIRLRRSGGSRGLKASFNKVPFKNGGIGHLADEPPADSPGLLIPSA